MRFVVARIDLAARDPDDAQIRRALETVSTVQHVHTRRRHNGWLVGAFITDDGNDGATAVEASVHAALTAALPRQGALVTVASELLIEGGDGLSLLRALAD